MQRVHKVALDVNNVQRTYLMKCAGTARFAFNWALSRWGELHEAKKDNPTLPSPSQYLLRRELNAIKKEKYPWMHEVTKCAAQEAIIDLGRAFENFFSGRAAYPTYKKKGLHDSFRVSSGFFKVSGNRLYLPKIGWIRMRECLRYKDARVISATISRTANRWFASLVCEIEHTSRKADDEASGNVIGIDMGLREFVSSENERFELPRSFREAERRLCRAQKSLARKQKGSKNREKQREKVARIHAQTACIRADWLHKLSASVVAENEVIVVEGLNVKGMVKNRYLAKSVSDAAFGEFKRQLTYKAEEIGHTLVVADKFFPSSKLCSVCGTKTKHLSLSTRSWKCEGCNTVHDRDLNAAINLKKYAASSAVSACGEFLTADEVALYGAPSSSRLNEAGTKHQIYPV